MDRKSPTRAYTIGNMTPEHSPNTNTTTTTRRKCATCPAWMSRFAAGWETVCAPCRKAGRSAPLPAGLDPERTCALPECGNPLPVTARPATLYCSMECSTEMNRRRARDHRLADPIAPRCQCGRPCERNGRFYRSMCSTCRKAPTISPPSPAGGG